MISGTYSSPNFMTTPLLFVSVVAR